MQELFTNTQKYAQASRFEVDLHVRQGVLHVQIKADGVGFDFKTENAGTGLTEINSRVEAYGGKWKILTAPGKGCKLDIQIPLPTV